MVNYLAELHKAVTLFIKERAFHDAVQVLKTKIVKSEEPFVWSVIDLDGLGCELPAAIKSGWIFVLKRGVPSGAHYHPNSIQHMVLIEGSGRARIGDRSRPMVRFGSPEHTLEECWYVIDQGVPHEFFPEVTDMVVVSFHTCPTDELIEIACGTGEKRLYEG